MRFLLSSLLLALTFIAVTGQWGPVDLILALAVGCFITFLFGRFDSESTHFTIAQTLALPWLFFGALIELFRGSWQMLLVLLGIRTWKTIGLVEIPYGDRTPRGALVTALIATASPGSMVIELDDERRVMIFNVIDASDPDAVRESFNRFYNRFQRYAIP